MNGEASAQYAVMRRRIEGWPLVSLTLERRYDPFPRAESDLLDFRAAFVDPRGATWYAVGWAGISNGRNLIEAARHELACMFLSGRWEFPSE